MHLKETCQFKDQENQGDLVSTFHSFGIEIPACRTIHDFKAHSYHLRDHMLIFHVH
jgi:hypothetical protein